MASCSLLWVSDEDRQNADEWTNGRGGNRKKTKGETKFLSSRSLFKFHKLPELTFASEPALTTTQLAALVRSKPPKLYALCGEGDKTQIR